MVAYNMIPYVGVVLFAALYISDTQCAVVAECVRLFADKAAFYVVSMDIKIYISYVKHRIDELNKWFFSWIE